MISVIKITSGGYNVIGIEDDMFFLQGHLNEQQLKELIKEAKQALKGAEA